MVAVSRTRLPSLYTLSAGYGRTAPYRRLHQLLPIHPPSARANPLRAAPLTPYRLPSARQFSLNGAWRQEPQQKRADAEPADTSNEKSARAESSEPHKASESAESESSGDKRSTGEGEGEQKSEENAKDENSKEEGGKEKEGPAPPPHGDKTPWQVFTETLQNEFKASKEWTESTKALQSGYQDIAQNPALKKAKSAYEEASQKATDTTTAALKNTGKAIGQGAVWAWETPVAKVVRKGAVVAGSGIEKVTRPVRETEAFKQVKDVIDDGGSSRYGGWVDKEERRRIRAQREAQAEKDGLRAPPAEADPEYVPLSL
jgi:import inner membrane translocase subunit TIM44